MSAATATPVGLGSATVGRGRGTLAGTGTLLRFMLRRDRVRLPGWVLGITAMAAYFGTAVAQVYGQADGIAGIATIMSGPMGALFGGPGYGMDAPTIEAFVAGLYGLYLLIAAGLMSIFTVTRHTRHEERSGRAELVRAYPVGRHAPLTATMTLVGGMNLLLGVLVAVTFRASGFPATGSWLFSAGTAAVGLSFAGIAAVTAQVTEFPRAASGLAGGTLGLAYVLRALGDMTSEHGNLLSWLSPIGWAQQTAPYVLDRWWPLLLNLVLAAGTAALAYGLSARRDLAAGLVAARAGSPTAAPWLRGPVTLALRLNRASLIGWTLVMAALGLAYGAFAQALVDGMSESAPEILTEIFGGADHLVAGYLGMMALTMALTTTIFAVVTVQGLRAEENEGRAEAVLATAVSRPWWLGVHVKVAAAGSAWLMLVAGLGVGAGAAASTGDGALFGQAVVGHLAQVPAVWVVLALAALAYGFVPRLVPVAWALLVYSLFAGFFGAAFRFPAWATWLSPFDHVGSYPLEDVSLTALAALVAVAAVLSGAALVGFRRRDVVTR